MGFFLCVSLVISVYFIPCFSVEVLQTFLIVFLYVFADSDKFRACDYTNSQ